MTTQDIVTRDPAPLATTPSIGTILAAAVDRGMEPAALEKLVALYERMEAMNASKAFAAAMARFKSECPPIPRRTENPQFTVLRDGVKVARKFASIDDIEPTIRPVLSACGLGYRWGDSVIAGDILTLPCIVRHEGGHSESSSSSVPIGSSAGCSPQQKVGVAESYAMRYSLIKALGLTSCDEDTDGNPPPADLPTIDDNQQANLQALIDEVKANKAAFLAWLRVGSLAEIPVVGYKAAVAALEAKRGGNKK